MLRCQHQDRKDNCEQLLRKLHEKCNEMQTDPSLRDLLIKGMEGMFANVPDLSNHNKHGRTLETQNCIGWENVTRGRMSKEWEKSCNWHKRITNDFNNETDGLQWCVKMTHETGQWFLQEWLIGTKKCMEWMR